MGLEPKELKKRNQKLVKLKKDLSFIELAKLFDISEARTKEIYYREVKKINNEIKKEKVIHSRVLDNKN